MRYDHNKVQAAAEAMAPFIGASGDVTNRRGFAAEFKRQTDTGLTYPRDIADALVDAGLDPEMATAIAFDGLAALDEV